MDYIELTETDELCYIGLNRKLEADLEKTERENLLLKQQLQISKEKEKQSERKLKQMTFAYNLLMKQTK